jgi:shikimate dehydrogenase
MHAAAYAALGMAHTYEAIRANAAELPAVVARLRAGELAGLNVTVPHKIRVLDLVDTVAPSAAAVGAANTLVRDAAGRIAAHNTDVPALAAELAALAPHAGTALVLGTGGASRAAAAALGHHLHVARVVVRGRPLAPDPAVEASVTLVVQTTSCGMTGADSGELARDAVAWDALPPGAVVLDVVYAPPETPFLAEARRRGLRAANGVGMLARQGALAFELWLGVPAPLEAMLLSAATP